MGIANILFLLNITSGFKQLFLIFFILFILIYFFVIRNLFVTFLLLSVFALPIFSPNKFYTIEVLKGYELALPIFRDGYYLGFGLRILDIFLFFTLTAFVFDLFIKKNFLKFIENKFVSITIICWALFLFWGNISATAYSFDFVFSLVWLIQYSYLFLIAIFISYFFTFYKESVKLIYVILLSSVIFQGIIAIGQFLLQGSIGISMEMVSGGAFYTGADENNSLTRSSGISLYHNQFALISLVSGSVLLPWILEKKSWLRQGGLLLILLSILFSQSRSIWLITFFVIIFARSQFRDKIKKIARLYSGINFRLYLIGTFIFVLASFIFIPRFLQSANIFASGGGIQIRVKMISEGLSALSENLLIGYGVGTNEHVLYNMFPNGTMSVFPAAIHFAYLQLLLEIGLIGGILFLAPIVVIFRKCINTFLKTSKVDNYTFTFFSGLSVFMLYYLFQPHVGIIEFPFLGLILGFGLICLKK